MGKRRNLKINFDKSLYSISAVKKAIDDYQGLAKFSLEQKKDCIEVGIKDIKEELKHLLKEEFCNYVLSLEGTMK